MNADPPLSGLTLNTWPQLSDAYPFSSCRPADLSGPAFRRAFEMLEAGCQPRVYLLGSLYEVIVDEPLAIDEAGRPYIKKDRKRRLAGQFYTPPHIVHYCFQKAFGEDLPRFISGVKAAAEAGNEPCHAFRIIDPACGPGNFLIGLVEIARAGGAAPGAVAGFIQRCLFGIELDPRAAALCRLGLILCASAAVQELYRASGGGSAGKMLGELVRSLERHIVVGDALMVASVYPADAPRFDIVATNPPYISFGSRNQSPLPGSQSRYLRLCFPRSSEYKIRVHSLFQEVALRLAARAGRVVLLLPDAFLTGGHYQRLRKLLLESVRIESLTELPDDVIGDAVVGRWCVASYRAKEEPDPGDYELELCSFVGDGQPNGAQRAEDDRDASPRQRYRLPLSALVSRDRERFRLVFGDLDRQLWQRLDRRPQLGTVLTGHTGMRARGGQATIVSDRRAGAGWRPGITSGGQVERHRAAWRGHWLHVEPALLFAGGFDPAVVERPKLLVRQTADRIIAAPDRDGLYHLNNVHSFSPAGSGAGLDLYLLDAIMNSIFWLYLYQSKSREQGRALAQIDIEMVESMPLPELDAGLCRALSRLARAAGCNEAAGKESGFQKGQDLLFLIERSIDRLVYDLYDLTDDQVSHVESSCRLRVPYAGDLPARARAVELADSVSSLLSAPTAQAES